MESYQRRWLVFVLIFPGRWIQIKSVLLSLSVWERMLVGTHASVESSVVRIVAVA